MTMTSLVRSLAVVGALASAPAFAADLPYAQAPMSTPMMGGFYLGLKGGANFMTDTTYLTGGAAAVTNTDYNTGWTIAGAAGYSFGPRWGAIAPRLEFELGYLANDVDAMTITAVTQAAVAGKTTAFYGLVNGYLDFNMGGGFTPFVGAGIGFGNVDFNGHGNPGVLMNDSDTSFAWNVTAGVGYELTRNVSLELSYRYLSFTNVGLVSVGTDASSTDVNSHQILGGVRVKF